MSFDNLFPIAYLGIGGICALAILLTAILFLLKKKTSKTLTLYGLCVALLLVGGFLASNDNPFPQPRIHTPEVSYPQDSRGSTPSYILEIQQKYQPAPEYEFAVDENAGSIIESEPEAFPEIADSNESDPEPTGPVTAKVSSRNTGRNTTKTISNDTSPAFSSNVEADASARPQSAISLDENPSIAPDPVFAAMDNPQLALEPILATMSNPAVLGEPESVGQPVQPSLQGSTQNSLSTSFGGNSAPSNADSSNTYIHDFSNGRLLGTIQSDKYHCKDCSAAQKIPPSNEIWFNSVSDAVAHGYKPCGICYR